MKEIARTWLLLIAARLARRRQRIFIEYTDTGAHIIHPWTLGRGEL
jgi:hypothetical protein